MIEMASPEFAGFFENAASGRVAFPYCRDCGRFHWYPMPLCPHCRCANLEWRQVQGPARLYTWTVVRHPFDPKLADAVPYVVGLVSFDDAPGIRLVTNIVSAAPAALRIGMAVELATDGSRSVAGRRQDPPALTFRPAAG